MTTAAVDQRAGAPTRRNLLIVAPPSASVP